MLTVHSSFLTSAQAQSCGVWESHLLLIAALEASFSFNACLLGFARHSVTRRCCMLLACYMILVALCQTVKETA